MNRQAVQTLKTYFGYDTFREGQESVVESILEHRDVLAIMPTGAGKSICYQVPALMLSGITIVISPLISMKREYMPHLSILHCRKVRLARRCTWQQEEDTKLFMLHRNVWKIMSFWNLPDRWRFPW